MLISKTSPPPTMRLPARKEITIMNNAWIQDGGWWSEQDTAKQGSRRPLWGKGAFKEKYLTSFSVDLS